MRCHPPGSSREQMGTLRQKAVPEPGHLSVAHHEKREKCNFHASLHLIFQHSYFSPIGEGRVTT